MFSLVRNGIALAAVAAVGFGAMASAYADTMTYSGYSLPNEQNVKILAPNGPGNVPFSQAVGAGHFAFTNVYFGTVSQGNVNAWCIDLQHWFVQGAAYNFGTAPLTIDVQLEALLLAASAPNFFTANADNDAAMQVAIWKTVYPAFQLDASFGNDPAITTLATQFITNVTNATWQASPLFHIATLTAADAMSNQQLITLLQGPGGGNNNTVPEPASLVLLSAGLIALGAARRRNRGTLH